jgi:hypothetical protein
MDLKILLVLDNAPGHPPVIETLSKHIKVNFFRPPPPTRPLQPMDHRVIATFKAYCLRKTLAKLSRRPTVKTNPL